MKNSLDIEDGKRQAIVDAGRELFLKNTYSNISIRRIAEKAGVNSALIAYYFGSKSGLYKEVIMTFLEDNLARLEKAMSDLNSNNLQGFFSAFYETIPPELTQLVLHTLLFERGEMRDWLIEMVFKRINKISNFAAQSVCEHGGKELNPKLIRTIIQSLLVMPKIMHSVMEEIDPDGLDELFYEQLAMINSQMILRYFDVEGDQ